MFDLINGIVQADATTRNVGNVFAGPDSSAPGAGQAPAADAPGGGGIFGMIGQAVGDVGRGLSQEGLAGLLDPSGMMDRQQAQRDLMGQFHVENAEDIGPGAAGNNVTPEQFQAIARQYSDVRMGRGDLQISLPEGTSPEDEAAYRAGTMTDVGRMLQTKSGRDLVGQLSNNVDADGDHHTTTIAGNDANAQNATENSAPNGGSSVTYNPGSVWTPMPGAPAGETWMPMRSDVQLFHELTHSLHRTTGSDAAGTVSTADLDGAHVGAHDHARLDVGGIAREEHNAVGIGAYSGNAISENSYRRERAGIAAAGGPGIVGGVGGDAGMAQRSAYGEHGLGAPIP